MPRFFIRQDQINENTVTLKGDDAHHIARSLRMAVGDEMTVCDMQGYEYKCRISGFESDTFVYADIVSTLKADTEPPCHITLFQALSKGDKLDSVIQKAVECGACRIVPFESERCVVRVKGDSEERKTERRRRIAHEAAKQCGRGVLPEVLETVSFDRALAMAKEADVLLFCYEGDGTEPLGRILAEVFAEPDRTPSISVIVGSEGGFSIDEAERARQSGARMTGLGKRILRTETAPVFVLSCICCAAELG